MVLCMLSIRMVKPLKRQFMLTAESQSSPNPSLLRNILSWFLYVEGWPRHPEELQPTG